MVVGVGGAGCSFDPSSVPLPGVEISGGTYQMQIEFASALNLPARAKVVAGGAKVGELTRVDIVDASAGRPGYVTAHVRISDTVKLSVDTTAQLRQNTVLGDVFIALTTPAHSAAKTIGSSGTIPLSHTIPALQIEDLMSGMATFFNSGAVNQFQNIVDRMNRVLPQNPVDTAHAFDVVGSDLEDVSANLGQVDRFLSAATADTHVFHDDGPELNDLLTPQSATHVTGAVASLADVIKVLSNLGGVAHDWVWLGPLVASGDAAASAFVPLALTDHPLDLNAPSNLNKLVALLRDKVIPFAASPKVDITGVNVASAGATSVPAADQVDRILATLRMIGAVR
ncbi:MlaD family protein [Nocardia coffeae]|uniref:MlaD family protein n=1 Tax=Nocardia coffeae TaxID=2873381 RepID=UPI001F248DBA|nr:MlaD family protein [Nocardia coffeae]